MSRYDKVAALINETMSPGTKPGSLGHRVEGITFHWDAARVQFHGTLTYRMLDALASGLGTNQIDIESENGEQYGEDTGQGMASTTLTIRCIRV